jgi:glycogen operon protein
MTDEDWHDSALRTIGMFVSGRPLREPGPRGEQQIDTSFLIWFHAGAEAVEVHLPDNDWVHAGSVVLSTDPGLPEGTELAVGALVSIGARSVVVMQETDA